MNCYNYYYTKQLTAISFSRNPNKYFNKTHLTDTYLEFLYEKVMMNELTMINEQMKYNWLELINYIRFNRELTGEKINIINEIIIKINSTKVSFYPYQVYLSEEFDLRMPDGQAELNFLDDNQIDELLSAIEFDFTVLNSLLCSEEKYNKLLITTLSLNEFYFGSINKLKTEIPGLIDRQMIRIMEVIFVNRGYKKKEYKKNIVGYDSKKFKTVIKEGNKLLKKMKN